MHMSTCFGPWLDLTYVDNEEDLIHYMLQKQVFSLNEHYDLPLIYDVNEHLLHFGRREFCLITGFKFGIVSFRKFREGDISFRDRVFPEKIGRYVKTIDLLSVIEDQERFTKLSDEDSVRVCLLLSLEVIFMGRELGSIVDDVLLRMVDDLEAWNEFPWGEHIWRELYAAIRNVNSKHNIEHHKSMDKDPNFVPSYSLSGFLLCFKIWILESSSQTDRWWSKEPDVIPRGCSWSKHFTFQKWEAYSQLFPQAKNPNFELYPNHAEGLSKWFRESQKFFKWYTPRAPPAIECGGLVGDYLKKLSSARGKVKDREAHPVRQSCTCGLRVKALERLCERLLILPKEIEILKERVYKIDYIMHYITRKTKGAHPKQKVSTSVQKNGLVDVDKLSDEDLSEDGCVKAEKHAAEIYRQAIQREQRSKLILEEENKMKSIERCGTTKRRYVNVLRPQLESPYTDLKVPSMDELRKRKNVLHPFMIEMCADLQPWEEDSSRRWKRIDKVYYGFELENFLFTSSHTRCKFPWSNDITVDRTFWEALLCIDEKRIGWLLDEHIDLWVWYMWYFRDSSADWSMLENFLFTSSHTRCKFPWYNDITVDRTFWEALLCIDEKRIGWLLDEHIDLWVWYMWYFRDSSADWSMVFIPINEPKQHWSLAHFHIKSGHVTFYDSEGYHEPETRPWYLNMRRCLECNLPAILEQTDVFGSKGINLVEYSIKFKNAHNIPKQGGIFGDCGVFVCLFLYRQAIQREQRSKLILEEENKMKSIEVLNAPSHLKLALQRCGTTKRRYVNVLRPQLESPYTDLKVPSMDELRKRKNVLHPFMIEMCADLQPWEEDSRRRWKRIDKVYCGFELENFLFTSSHTHCKFPWYNDITVDRTFWEALLCIDEKRIGWLLDERSSAVSCYFVTLLLQNSMPLFYATDEIYPIAWKNVEQVFIPINEPKQHWSLAHFHIKSGLVTFYDSEGYHEPETRPWYLNMRRCLECNLPAILEQTDVFGSKGINPVEYSIKFKNAHIIPKQGGIFGDCGIFVCLFLYRLSHGMPLAVVDPVQTALAYREQMARFYFKHKIFF
ncbi:phospholipase-like, Aminotransferase-like mobile domain protein [Artemisia annua]|uniref:Phospholipase-like, Aminotransferase-like mobile domain protein n=1 Tax=Artemisia annua TaxID=35608 RepID=A0A2U1KMK5_ARTAN|nr:phospholipase-like, Aminotransferase-like mobile domain protein [Artemisia annua]